MNTTDIAIQADDISKSFVIGKQKISVLKDINFTVQKGDFLVIFGPSGSGKSTLLHIILGLEPPNSGKMKLLGKDPYNMTDDQQADFRKENIGMVYQQPYWIKSLKVVENVAFPLILLGEEKKKSLEKAQELLKTLSMSDWSEYFPSELSSGQQQRISLARALISNPQLIIADEPTGNLDYDSGLQLMELLTKINKDTGKTILMVTHDLEYMKFVQRSLRMLDGQIVEQLDKKGTDTYLKKLHSKRGNGHEIE